jgi:hypothetical protein
MRPLLGALAITLPMLPEELRLLQDELRKKGQKIAYNELRKKEHSNAMIERLKRL